MSATAKLPDRAAIKFAALSDAAEEARTLVLADQRRITSIEDQRRHVDENNEETFAALTAEIERVSQRRDRHNEQFLHQTRLVTAIRSWLMQVPAHFEFFEADMPRPDPLRDSEAVDDEVTRCREEIATLQAERVAVAGAVPPLPDLYFAADAYVEALAERGRPRVAVARGELVVRPAAVEGSGFGRSGGREEMLGVCAWLFPDVMRDRLHQQIDVQHESDVRRKVRVMSIAERDAELARIDSRVLELERREEFLVELGETYDMRIPRRDDANPLAILGVEMGRPPREQRAVAAE